VVTGDGRGATVSLADDPIEQLLQMLDRCRHS
jgi:hypothetical protein